MTERRQWRVPLAPGLLAALAVAAGAAAGPVAAQDRQGEVRTIEPAGDELDGRRIPAYTNAWRSYRLEPGASADERRPLAVWYDTVTVVRDGSGEMLRRVQRIVRDDGPTTVLVNEADRRTLLPRRTTARRDGGAPFIDLSFDGTRVEGRRPLLPRNGGPGGAVSVQMTLELPRPVYDWRWWGLLIAALPLERGYEARMLTFATAGTLPSPLLWVTARVVGGEPVGPIECWVVEVDAGVPWTLWIARDREAAPVQRIRIEQPDGGVVLWEPLSRSN